MYEGKSAELPVLSTKSGNTIDRQPYQHFHRQPHPANKISNEVFDVSNLHSQPAVRMDDWTWESDETLEEVSRGTHQFKG